MSPFKIRSASFVHLLCIDSHEFPSNFLVHSYRLKFPKLSVIGNIILTFSVIAHMTNYILSFGQEKTVGYISDTKYHIYAVQNI